MQNKSFCLVICLALSLRAACAQGTVPTFHSTTNQGSYTLAGRDPGQGGTTVIPTVLVPVTLSFEAKKTAAGAPVALDAGSDVTRLLHSPIFSNAPFPVGGTTQYVDAMLRATFPAASGWHTLLGQPEVKPLQIAVPIGYGYVLSSKKSGSDLGMVDLEYLQREIFKRIPRQEGKLVIAVTHNTGYYAYGDATVCCSWGTHGIDAATGNSFVLASWLDRAPPIVEERDAQPLTEQLAEFAYDPVRDALSHSHGAAAAENTVGAWMRPAAESRTEGGCGGTGIATRYTLLEPTDTNPRSDLPQSKPYVVLTGGSAWHVQNVALLRWYPGLGTMAGRGYSFPDAQALTTAAAPCPARHGATATSERAVAAIPLHGRANGHQLIGYWTGEGSGNSILRLRDVPPQWDVILVAFAVPEKSAPEGTLLLQLEPGIDLAQFREDVAWLKSRGKKVMISLGGGGQYFTLDHASSIPNFVSSVTQIVSEYGFDGIDLDFESPSLMLNPGDADFRHPTTPSIVNLIEGLHQLRSHFGPHFMISLVPEGTQIPGGYPSYGGQFGTYLPLLWGVRDILSFVDVQDYNTPPFQGLDGEIYQMGSVDYDAAMTELLLQGFPVGGGEFFPPVPADKVAVGFLVGATTPAHVHGAMQYLITGRAPAGVTYRLRKPGGYPDLIGAMFWTIDGDLQENYGFSNLIGPQLHSYPTKH